MTSQRILITGHTGFKGSWLAARLATEGHSIFGYSDVFRSESLYRKGKFGRIFSEEFFGDVRDRTEIRRAIESSRVDTVIHLAAQPIVLTGYQKPLATFETNFNGSLNVIESCLNSDVKKLLVVTTDKVYFDDNRVHGYMESDKLGGFDPYAASKAAADIATQSYMGFLANSLRIDVARGGNVIGGGDDSSFRLIPDIEKAIRTGSALEVRNPHQVRPWQHAMDCLDGYMAILNRSDYENEIWNVGPSQKDSGMSVEELVALYNEARSASLRMEVKPLVGVKETATLKLDISKIETKLGWAPRWSTVDSVQKTAEWHLRVELGEDPFAVTMSQVDDYLRRTI